MRPSNNLENKNHSDTNLRVQLVSMKVQAHSSLESPPEYNQDQTLLTDHYNFFNHFWSYRNILPFQISSRKLKSFKKFFANNFALSDTEDNTSGLLNRGSIVDSSLMRTLLPIRQKSKESSFCEVMGCCFISTCKFGSFKNPFPTIARRFILLVKTKKVIPMNYGSNTTS